MRINVEVKNIEIVFEAGWMNTVSWNVGQREKLEKT